MHYCIGLGQSSFLCPSSQRSIVAIYVCPFTCGHSFTVCSGWGVFSFWSFFSVFSHPPSPLFHYCVYYYRLFYCLLLLLFLLSSRLAGRAGFWNVLATWVWGWQLLGTQTPYATQALNLFNCMHSTSTCNLQYNNIINQK